MKYKYAEIIKAPNNMQYVTKVNVRISQKLKINRFCIVNDIFCVGASVFEDCYSRELFDAILMIRSGWYDGLIFTSLKLFTNDERRDFLNQIKHNSVNLVVLDKIQYFSS